MFFAVHRDLKMFKNSVLLGACINTAYNEHRIIRYIVKSKLWWYMNRRNHVLRPKGHNSSDLQIFYYSLVVKKMVLICIVRSKQNIDNIPLCVQKLLQKT